MSNTKKPPAPEGLGPAGLNLWSRIAGSGNYELRPDELSTLEGACVLKDLSAVMQRELARDLADGLIKVKGSQGQPVTNTLVADIRQTEATITSMLAKLKLPDAEGGESTGENPRSTAARTAANARWSKPA